VTPPAVRAAWLDELPGIDLRLLDLALSVRGDDPDLLDLLGTLFAETRVEDGAIDHVLALAEVAVDGREGCFASVDGSIVVRTPARGIAFTNLVFEANQRAIAATGGLRLHAGAVAYGDRAVLLPGAMGAGKSTLTAGLVARGGEYVTDEVAALAGTAVRSYPRPLSLGARPPASIAGCWAPPDAARRYLGASGLVPPAALGVTRAAPTEVALVVLPEYVPDAPTVVERLDGPEALAAVAAQTFDLGRPGTLGALAGLLAGVEVHALRGGDLDTACGAVEDLMGRAR
jgi:hypothetical protein